jgi:hypothetical protein
MFSISDIELFNQKYLFFMYLFFISPRLSLVYGFCLQARIVSKRVNLILRFTEYIEGVGYCFIFSLLKFGLYRVQLL